MPIHLFHYTSLGAAIKIIRTQKYRTASGDPMNGDSGMNVGIVDEALSNQHFEGWDVTLYFDFDGPLVPMTSFPLPVGSVYNALPWRAVVPLGTTKELRLIKLEEEDTCDWLEMIPPAPWWIPFKKWYRKKKAQKLREQTFAMIAKRPLIKVVGKSY